MSHFWILHLIGIGGETNIPNEDPKEHYHKLSMSDYVTNQIPGKKKHTRNIAMPEWFFTIHSTKWWTTWRLCQLDHCWQGEMCPVLHIDHTLPKMNDTDEEVPESDLESIPNGLNDKYYRAEWMNEAAWAPDQPVESDINYCGTRDMDTQIGFRTLLIQKLSGRLQNGLALLLKRLQMMRFKCFQMWTIVSWKVNSEQCFCRSWLISKSWLQEEAPNQIHYISMWMELLALENCFWFRPFLQPLENCLQMDLMKSIIIHSQCIMGEVRLDGAWMGGWLRLHWIRFYVCEMF